jgi:hypothetical protein
MNQPKTKLDWQIEQHRLELAGEQADALVARLMLTAPIDPFKVIRSETPFLRAGGHNFGNRYDGKLKYNREKNRFLLFFNTKYDLGMQPGCHHPRTRFSIAHELGHYFIEPHHQNLRRGGKPHPSSSEFRTDVQMEREADAFAASLLLPTPLIRPIVNQGELTLEQLGTIAGDYQTSLLSTTVRGVRLSDYPCAVAGIRDGHIAWMFPSEKLIDGGCYPGRKSLQSPVAQERWTAFLAGRDEWVTEDGKARDWFQMFDREDDLFDVYVTEQYLPVRIMNTLVVLLTMNDEDLFSEEEDEDDGEHRARFGY